MYWAIEHIINKYAANRKVAILSTSSGARGMDPLIIQEIEKYATVSLVLDSTAQLNEMENLAEYYLVVCEDIDLVADGILRGKGLNEIQDYYNWAKHERTNGHLPIDVKYNGVNIGYGSYFPFDKKTFKHISSIGRFCSISRSASIQGNHSMNRITTSSLYPLLDKEAERIKDITPSDKDLRGTNRKVSIGNDVWIGANVFINASKVAVIGDGAVIGAGSLVHGDVPPYSIVYGAPAKVQRYRFSEDEIDVLMNVKWWDWDKEKINKNIESLMNPEIFFKKFGDAKSL